MRTALLLASLLLSTGIAQAQYSAEEVRMLDRGQLNDYIAEVKNSADNADPDSLLHAGNKLYPFAPVHALELHLRALKIRDSSDIHLELAYDYSALQKCEEANRSWKRAGEAIELNSSHAAIQAFCLLKQGAVDQALAAWQAADYGQNHTGIEKAIAGVFSKNPAISNFEGVERFRSLGWSNSGAWVLNAFRWELDWWNTTVNHQVVGYMLESLRARKDLVGIAELECSIKIEAADEEARLPILRACNLLVDQGALPKNSGIAYLLTAMTPNLDLKALYKRHQRELLGRANSKTGDLEALKLASFLAVQNNDKAQLAKLDQLGWGKYQHADSAGSFLAGIGVMDGKKLSTSQRKELNRALAQFPNNALFQMLALHDKKPAGNALKERLIELITAEYHRFYFSSNLSAPPNARGLHSFFLNLATLRQLERENTVPTFENIDL